MKSGNFFFIGGNFTTFPTGDTRLWHGCRLPPFVGFSSRDRGLNKKNIDFFLAQGFFGLGRNLSGTSKG